MVGTAIYGHFVLPAMRVPNALSLVAGIAIAAFGIWFHRIGRKSISEKT